MNQYQEVLSVHTFPLSNSGSGTRFMARPLQQWRKQYQSTLAKNRNASVGMPMDRPGSSNQVSSKTIQCKTCDGSATLNTDIINDTSACTSCNIIKSNTKVSDTEYKDTSSYLQSRCSTYEQNTSTRRRSSINYFTNEGTPINPSDSPTGTQVYETKNCYTNQNSNNQCNKTIYKPNNVQYAQQGGVSSGSRISRLKYNTLNNNGAAFNSASGALGFNTGRYQTEPSPSYFNKNKPQKVVFPRKNGANNHCPSPSSSSLSSTDYSMCMLE